MYSEIAYKELCDTKNRLFNYVVLFNKKEITQEQLKQFIKVELEFAKVASKKCDQHNLYVDLVKFSEQTLNSLKTKIITGISNAPLKSNSGLSK